MFSFVGLWYKIGLNIVKFTVLLTAPIINHQSLSLIIIFERIVILLSQINCYMHALYILHDMVIWRHVLTSVRMVSILRCTFVIIYHVLPLNIRCHWLCQCYNIKATCSYRILQTKFHILVDTTSIPRTFCSGSGIGPFRFSDPNYGRRSASSLGNCYYLSYYILTE